MKQLTSLLYSLRALIQSDKWPLVLAVSGTLLRFALIGLTLNHERFYDEIDYETIGLAISQGLGFKNGTYFTAYRAPGQLVFVGSLFAIFGHHPLVVEIAEAVLLAILPFLCSRIGRAIGLSPLAANLGATLAAFHPALTYAVITFYPTVLTTCALTLGVWLCWESLQRNRASLAVAEGVALGIAGAATTTFAPFAFLAAIIIAFKNRFKLALLIAFFGLAPALAWMVRNDIVLHDFALATNGGYNLELGANDQATPRSGNWVELTPDWIKGEVYLDRVERDQAVAWIHAHPGRYAELAVLRAFAVFDSEGKPKTQGLHSGRVARLAAYGLFPVMLFGLLGLLFRWKHPLAWLTAAALGLVILSSALTIAKPRFRFPCDPLLCVFAISGAVDVSRRVFPPTALRSTNLALALRARWLAGTVLASNRSAAHS